MWLNSNFGERCRVLVFCGRASQKHCVSERSPPRLAIFNWFGFFCGVIFIVFFGAFRPHVVCSVYAAFFVPMCGFSNDGGVWFFSGHFLSSFFSSFFESFSVLLGSFGLRLDAPAKLSLLT